VDPRNHILDGGTDSPWEEAMLRGKGMPQNAWRHSWHRLCKNGWTNRFAVWVVDLGGPKGAQSYSPACTSAQGVLIWGQDDATWWIQLNRPSAAVMLPWVKFLWPLLLYLRGGWVLPPSAEAITRLVQCTYFDHLLLLLLSRWRH